LPPHKGPFLAAKTDFLVRNVTELKGNKLETVFKHSLKLPSANFFTEKKKLPYSIIIYPVFQEDLKNVTAIFVPFVHQK